jgi:hypothetical protein
MLFVVPEVARADSDRTAAASRADAPGYEMRAGTPRPLRPSRVPFPGETARMRRSPLSGGRQVSRARQSRPSGARTDAEPVLGRPSAVPAQSVRDMLPGPAQPLAARVKQEMEDRLGANFANVRVHTGEAARASAAQLGARAYTVGDHVVTGDRGSDKHTLAHELTHVIQQRQGPVAGTSHGGLKVSDPSDVFERAAEANAARVMRAPLSGHRQAPAEGSGWPPAGNAASGGRVPSRGTGAEAPVVTVQRKVGFEAELSVPTMPALPSEIVAKNPDGVSAPDTVEGFLRGGVPYGTEMGKSTRFTLKPDHNLLQNRHFAIREKLKGMGWVLPEMDNDHTMSNLEYVTSAHDELAPSSTAEFKNDSKAIIDHARSLFSDDVYLGAFALPAPARDYRTGIPFSDLKNWLGPHYPEVKQQVNEYVNEIRNSFYLQATVGIIPSALADLHKTKVPWGRASNAREAAAKGVDDAVSSLLKLRDFAKHDYVVNLRKNHPIDYEALVGLLYLTFTYLVGSTLNQTDLLSESSAKNSVPFLSKMKNLSYVINTAVPDELQKNKPPTDLIKIIKEHFNGSPYVDVDYWARQWGLKLDPNRKPTITSSIFVNDVLKGREPDRIGAATAPDRTFSAPDPMPHVSAASGGQSGVQVEYRRITARPSTDDLTEELMKVVKEARKLNTRHLKSSKQTDILKAADR